jgi:hypothetical protein
MASSLPVGFSPFALLLAAFVALAILYLLFLEPWGHDTWFHLQRLLDIEQQVRDGRIPAHFAGNAVEGKGLPVWIYYSQWVYWPALLFRAVGVAPLVALKIVYCAFLLIACLGCYRLLRLDTGADGAAFGTLLFMTSNFVIGEVFQRSAYAEFLSVALLPCLLAAMHRSLVDGGFRAGIVVAMLAALMILFHPLSFMNAGWALLAYAIFTLLGRRIPMARLLRLLPPLALAFGLTAFYWLPAVVETRHVLGAAGVPTPVRETFLSLKLYLNFSGIRSLGLLLTVLTPLVFARLLIARPAPADEGRRPHWPLVAAILLYVYLTLPVSQPLYDHIAMLASNLWVWRVLYPMTLLAVLLVALNLELLPSVLKRRASLHAIGVVAVLQAAAMVLWNTAGELSLRELPMQEIEANLAEEIHRTEGWGIDEYLPNPDSVPSLDCPEMRSVSPPGHYQIRLEIAPDEADACVHVPRYWNVRYVASIDGEAVRVSANADGEILIAPSGRSGRLKLRFARPRYVSLAGALSVLSAVMLVAAATLVTVARRKARE